MDKIAVKEYISSQRSLHLYKNIQDALYDVLCNLSVEQFEKVKNYLIVMAFHNGIVGQVMHFEPRTSNFSVMQLYIPSNMPEDVLREVIAHELGHVFQERNWIDSDGTSLEDDADNFAIKIGFPKTPSISKWLADFAKS